MTLGRNDPCHCGSGEKYKKCHLPKDDAAAREKALAAQNAAKEEAAKAAAEAEEKGEGDAKARAEAAGGRAGRGGSGAGPGRSKAPVGRAASATPIRKRSV